MERIEIPDGLANIVTASPPVTTNGGVTADYISLKNVHRALIVATFTQAVSNATVIKPQQASAVAGTGAKDLDNVVPIWAIDDISASDVFAKQTDAVQQELAAGTTDQKVIFMVDPAGLDSENGFDCLGVNVANSSQATNFVSIEYILEMRYSNTSVIVD